MSVSSYPQLMLTLLFVIYCLIGQGEVNANRQRRQAAGGNTRNAGMPSGNPNGLIPLNNGQFNPANNQQQSNNNLLPSSQGQGQLVRSPGYYSSPNFKPPSFAGDKPIGWFETKYPNWVSNQDGQLNKVDGKNAPSSLQGKAIQTRREDGGEYFLAKLAKQYADKGEKSYNSGPLNQQKGPGSVCYNRQNYNGYVFNQIYCPLPPNTGMNQQDQFCCGIANYQYCCNEQEYNRNQNGGYADDANLGKHRHGKNRHYSSSNRALAIILPIIAVLVVVGALVIVFLYYKRLRNTQNKPGKSPVATRTTDDYTAVPQDTPVEKPPVPPRDYQKTTVQA